MLVDVFTFLFGTLDNQCVPIHFSYRFYLSVQNRSVIRLLLKSGRQNCNWALNV